MSFRRWWAILGMTGGYVGLVPGVEFDPGLLRQGSTINLERFQASDSVPQGDFALDIILNQQWIGRRTVFLRNRDASGQAAPCYDRILLEALGLDLARLAAQPRKQLIIPDSCMMLPQLLVAASEDLDFGALQLRLEIDRSLLRRQPQDNLPFHTWDAGVTAGFVDYRLNVHEQHDLLAGSRSQQGYLGLRAGFNTGDWYWRHEGNAQMSDKRAARYQPGATSVRRDVPLWSAQLTLGDGYAAGDVFDSSAFRGLRLSTDERMLPRAQRGFAPVVRGVANTTSLLSIRQRGMLLHESTVPPGPFEIDDLYASGLNDDLEVTLEEADGSVRRFTLPYQAAPLALREGASRFDLSAGVWRDDLGRPGPGHVQGSWQQGVDNTFSVHGGAWLAEDYLASAMGGAINSRFGAFGLTAYQAQASLGQGRSAQGQALRFSWRQRVEATATDLSASLTHRNNAGYYSFDEFARTSQQTQRTNQRSPQHWRAAMTLQQRLPGSGRLSVRASAGKQWGSGVGNREYNVGYYNNLRSLSYGMTLGREYRGNGQAVSALTLTASLPLGLQRRGSLSSSMSRDSEGGARTNVRWSATAGEDGQWGYGLSSVYQEGRQGGAGLDANLVHRSPTGELSGVVAQRQGSRQLALGARGSVVAHPGGVLLAQPLGESFAIVHAPFAEAARIQQHPSVRLNAQGFAVVPSLSPYSVNTVDLDPKGMSQDVELQISGQSVVPRAGAVTLLHYPTRSGRLLMLEARNEHGHALPFGAQVFDVQGDEVGMVGQGSRLHFRSHDERGRVRVSWGEQADASCWLDYAEGAASTCTSGPADEA